jgi:acetylornithine/N-succinyldiaminopimelate aminotransferase
MEGRFMMQEYIDKAEKWLIHTYNRYQIVFEKGDGVNLYDTDGKRYLDFTAGIAVFALGYGNQEYNNALKEQIDKLIHISNYFYSIPMAQAAEKFAKASGMDKVMFTNSGAEAIEGAIKLARRYNYNKRPNNNNEIIAMDHSFHGRTLGALSITQNEKYQVPFKPLLTGVQFAQFNNLESVKTKINENTCAIILEPIQGEGGIYPARQEFLEGLRAICDEKDILLIFDEIQCGMGRTGSMFAYQNYGVKPDIITSAKALGCGVPVGAFAAVEKVASSLVAGDHGSTYAGNPLVTAAVSKIFDLFETEKILENVKEVSLYLEEKLDGLMEKYDFIIDRRGKGLMQGLEFSIPVGDYIQKAIGKGLIIISAGSHTIRFLPALIITKQNVDEMVEILESCF